MKQGWEIKKIGELCILMTGGTPSRSNPKYFINGKIKWLVSGDVHKNEIIDCEGRITNEAMANSNAKYLPINSVIIALNGQGKTRGTVAILKTRATCNQSLVSIYPKDDKKILPKYIFSNLHGRYEEIRKITGDDGNDRRGLNMHLIRNIEIPLPPLEEQKRIVTILDEACAAISSAKTNAEKNLKNVKQLFESYLLSVFERPLQNWDVCNLEDHIKLIDYRGRTPVKTKSGVKLITAKNVKLGYLQLEPQEFINENNYDSWMSRGIPNFGDVIFTTEAPLANVAQIDTKEKLAFAQRIIVMQPKPNKIDQTFLKYMLLSNPIRKKILNKRTGATVLGIKSSLLKKIEIYFPQSITDQQTIVKKLDALSTETKKLETIYQQKITNLEELKKSILQKAFNGELT